MVGSIVKGNVSCPHSTHSHSRIVPGASELELLLFSDLKIAKSRSQSWKTRLLGCMCFFSLGCVFYKNRYTPEVFHIFNSSPLKFKMVGKLEVGKVRSYFWEGSNFKGANCLTGQ